VRHLRFGRSCCPQNKSPMTDYSQLGMFRLILGETPNSSYRIAVIVYISDGENSSREENKMTRISNLVLKVKVWKDTRGQDLIEYALMAGFVAVAAGAIMPGVASSISTIFSKVSSVMTAAASQS